MNVQALSDNPVKIASPLQGWNELVVEEEDWSGVYDCGAIFAPDRGMKFEVNEEEWPISNSCQIE